MLWQGMRGDSEERGQQVEETRRAFEEAGQLVVDADQAQEEAAQARKEAVRLLRCTAIWLSPNASPDTVKSRDWA